MRIFLNLGLLAIGIIYITKKVPKKVKTLILCCSIVILNICQSISVQAGENWLWPVPGHTNLSQGYSSSHDGIDINDANIAGADIVATKSGTVQYWWNNCQHLHRGYMNDDCSYTGSVSNGFGNGLVIKHDDGTLASYAHMAYNSIPQQYRQVGARVNQGAVIGKVGSSGWSTGYHLHFTICSSGTKYWENQINNNPGNISYTYSYMAPSVTGWDANTSYIDDNNAVINGTVNVSETVQFTNAGAYVWDRQGNLVAQASEGTNVNWNYMNITYNIVADMGVRLNSGVSYTYQFWASFGGKTYYSEKESFTTTWPANNNPLGAVDLIKGDTNSIYVGGWAFDSDQLTEQLAIVVYVGGEAGTGKGGHPYVITANTCRPDIEAIFPGSGMYHGFSSDIAVSETGQQNVAVYAANVGGGNDVLLGTGTVTILDRPKVGLVIENGIPYVYGTDGNLVRSGTPVINGKKYFVNENGIAQSGWLRLADWQMYFDPYTYEASTGISKIDGKAYLFDENGVEILKSRTEVINGKKYWFQPDGSLMSGWCVLGEWTMYYDPITYVGAAGLAVIDGKPYVFDGNGVLVKNGTPIIDGNKYYVNGQGIAQTGWLRLENWQMYFDPGTCAAATGITKVDGKAYLFDENGVEILNSRTEVVNGKIYWFQPDGSLMSGWCVLGQWTMYFDPQTYEAAVGRKTIDGVEYLFDRNGVLQ